MFCLLPVSLTPVVMRKRVLPLVLGLGLFAAYPLQAIPNASECSGNRGGCDFLVLHHENGGHVMVEHCGNGVTIYGISNFEAWWICTFDA